MQFERGGQVPSHPNPLPFEESIDRAEDDGTFRISQFAKLLGIARKRKWALAGMITAMLLLSLVLTMLATPYYTATAVIEIQRETRNFTNVEGAEADKDSTVDQEFYQTQYGLLQARSLADRVSIGLGLQDDAHFFALFGSKRAGQWFEGGRLKSDAAPRTQRIREAGDLLLENLRINPQRLSRLVEVKFSSPDPAFSKRIVDAWGTQFIQGTLERRFDTTSYARKFLEDRLGQLRTRIDEAERQLVTYAAREGIVNLPSVAADNGNDRNGERSLVAEDLVTLNRELLKATADRVLAQSRLGAAGGNTNEALANQGISDMRGARAQLAAQYAKMLQQFEPDYPPAQALRSQLAQLDQSIAREEARVRSTLQETYRASLQREQQLTGRVDQLKAGVLDLRRRSIQYNIFQRDVDTNRQLYDALLQRYKEIGVAGGVGVNNISVVDPAELPNRPSSPKLVLNLLLGLLAGIALGAAIAFLLEQIDEGIGDPAEVQESLDAPLLCTIPKSLGGDPVAALEDPKEALSEAYFSLQTNLAFATDHGFPHTLAVTSSRPAEGKSVTAFAIAKTLARPGRKVLLVDADMRSPSVHQMTGIDAKRGLSNYLAGSDDLTSLIQQTSHEGLSAMAAGPQPPSAAELLAGERLERLLIELRERFDYVIIDAPPVMGLADAPLIGARVEGTVFVIEAHATKKSVARVAVGRMRAARALIVGAILTKFDVKRAHYGYGYDYGYGYGYGPRELTPSS